jgi:hypothetical protein
MTTPTCDACRKSLEIGNAYQLVGMKIVVNDDFADTKTKKALIEAMLPYRCREYNICFPCLLKSLGVKP